MTIQSRLPKTAQCKVFPLDSHNGIGTYFNIYSDHSHYQVAIPRKPRKVEVNLTNGRKLTAYEYKPICRKWHPTEALEDCKGNSNGTICYHALAAIEHRVKMAGNKTLVKPEDGELSSAIKLLNLGGQLVKLTNQNGKSKWGVAR
jgi:hypothetical protein